ncbi:MAG: maleylpyruvate isomerase family mycothiol-dependent enzyme [Acidimicrobiales bacterium]
METAPGPWIVALRHSHGRLQALIEPLDAGQLEGRSYAADWSIAQVLSHLGSQAEIFSLWLDAGLSGAEPPGQAAFPPIWGAWNARSPLEQAADSLKANRTLVERFESLDDEQLERFHLSMFGMEIDTTALARMRLSEHAIHTWDVAVAFDPTATVSPEAVALLVDTLDQLVARAGKPDGRARRLQVATTNPERSFILEIGETVSLSVGDGSENPAELQLPAEAFVRLVYGRLDAAHTPIVEVGGVDLDGLRPIFPGL